MNDFLSQLEKQPGNQAALVIDAEHYKYGEIAGAARMLRKSTVFPAEKSLAPVCAPTLIQQLVTFLAYSGTSLVPLLLPESFKEPIPSAQIPKSACMAVMTSGTSGEPKLLYRSFESWAGFFPVQNRIFLTGRGTGLFLHGPLAFTGNLNLYLSQLSCGGRIITSRYFHPKAWGSLIGKENAGSVYLIPAKLRSMYGRIGAPLNCVRSIISGSQSLGAADVEALKPIFPKAAVFLYYGASELNYVTYTTGGEMNGDASLIGKPFPGVEVSLLDGEFFVRTPYCAEGISCPASIGDLGHMDSCGNFYFDGRKDDCFKINGVTISSLKVENALLRIPGIHEAAVIKKTDAGKEYLAAYIINDPNLSDLLLRRALGQFLSSAEIPKKFVRAQRILKNENGKILKRKLI